MSMPDPPVSFDRKFIIVYLMICKNVIDPHRVAQAKVVWLNFARRAK